MNISTILVANRGEIACRIIRSIHALGYRAVAVFSEADRDAPHVHLADEAVLIGPASARESYLSIPALIAAAEATGANAVHPGYGFLSENAGFARACAEAGLVFIGPSPEAIEQMGEKRRAKQAARDAGLPCSPGYMGDDQSVETLLAEARRAGFPLLIKAAAGGGGRGMRVVREEAELASRLASARAEAENAFGDGTLYLERLIENAHHIEIQVFADRHGNVIHLGERECSLQRRHQKIIEEAPSPLIGAALRDKLGSAAVDLAKAIGYEGAGTVEFMVEDSGAFFFLEMNTRLQVEHPVTEMVTGLDLVALQIRVAAGEPLPLAQGDVVLSGHAFEARLYAEDPYAGFLPQSGDIRRWVPPSGSGVRVDAGIAEGGTVTPFYDPMVAKLIVHGRDRAEALRKLRLALSDCVLLGFPTNRGFLAGLCDDPVFREGRVTTSYLDDKGAIDAPAMPDWMFVAAACLLCLPGDRNVAEWLRTGAANWPVALADGGAARPMRVLRSGGGELTVVDGATTHEVSIEGFTGRELSFRIGTSRRHIAFLRDGDTVLLQSEVLTLATHDASRRRRSGLGSQGVGSVRSPMNGRVMEVFVSEGEAIEAEAPIAILEAMKMHMEIRAPRAGMVASVGVAVGDQISTGHPIAEIALASEARQP